MNIDVRLVAHAGEEILIVLALGWIVYLLIKGMRSGRGEAPAAGPCLYCGTMLPKDVGRCPTCGFRARRGATQASETAKRP
jgi:hypothetical protein